MKGRPVADAITALGEPSTKRAVGNTMELVWSDYQTAPYTEWVSTGSSQVVGMIPATATTAATPVFQQSNSGYYGNRTKVYECKVVMRMQNSIIIDSQVDGNVRPEFINAAQMGRRARGQQLSEVAARIIRRGCRSIPGVHPRPSRSMTDLFPSRDTPLTDPLAAAFPAEIREDVSGVSALPRGWSRLMRPGPRPSWRSFAANT